MAKLPLIVTEADKAAFWNRRADEQEREAAKCTAKAIDYRKKAQQYLSPAPSGVQTAA